MRNTGVNQVFIHVRARYVSFVRIIITMCKNLTHRVNTIFEYGIGYRTYGRVSHVCFFIFDQSVDSYFFAVLGCYYGDCWLLGVYDGWHLFDDLAIRRNTLIGNWLVNLDDFEYRWNLIFGVPGHRRHLGFFW